MTISVEWRLRDGADSLVVVDPDSGTVSEVPGFNGDLLKTYLAVTGTLDSWKSAMTWHTVDDGNRDPDRWGELVLSRSENGDVIWIEPELFWESVHRWFRSKGEDYSAY